MGAIRAVRRQNSDRVRLQRQKSCVGRCPAETRNSINRGTPQIGQTVRGIRGPGALADIAATPPSSPWKTEILETLDVEQRLEKVLGRA
jgi:hypothetical protein